MYRQVSSSKEVSESAKLQKLFAEMERKLLRYVHILHLLSISYDGYMVNNNRRIE